MTGCPVEYKEMCKPVKNEPPKLAQSLFKNLINENSYIVLSNNFDKRDSFIVTSIEPRIITETQVLGRDSVALGTVKGQIFRNHEFLCDYHVSFLVGAEYESDCYKSINLNSFEVELLIYNQTQRLVYRNNQFNNSEFNHSVIYSDSLMVLGKNYKNVLQLKNSEIELLFSKDIGLIAYYSISDSLFLISI
jgi:hypothetical protein